NDVDRPGGCRHCERRLRRQVGVAVRQWPAEHDRTLTKPRAGTTTITGGHMKGHVLTTAFLFVPALLTAQQASASASATAQVTANAPASYTNYSAESRAKIDAAFQAARAKNLPDEPMRQRIAEGQAKGAGEAQVVAAVQRTQARLEAS